MQKEGEHFEMSMLENVRGFWNLTISNLMHGKMLKVP
jgi:hypothetical protein